MIIMTNNEMLMITMNNQEKGKNKEITIIETTETKII